MKLEFLNRLTSSWNDRDTFPRSLRVEKVRERLANRLGPDARLIVDESHRRVFSRDLADIPAFLEHALFRTTPLIVVQPRGTRDIAAVLQFANDEKIPVFPRGVASSAFGGPVPTTNGIVLDLSPMTTIDPPSPPASFPDGKKRAMVSVDAGARWGDIDQFLSPYGLQLYTYPSNRMATVAGWLASGGYGINGLKYGHVARHVAAMEVVTPAGEIKTVRADDIDFDKYFATEGLMGVIARVTLYARATPKHAMPHLLYFAADADAFRFVDGLLERGITPATVKFVDAHLMLLLNEHASREKAQAHLEEKPALLIFNDDAETEQRFAEYLQERFAHISSGLVAQAPKHIAGHLWSDRFFPMKIRAIGPSLLAAQIVLPTNQVAPMLDTARRLAHGIGLEPATEAHVITTPRGVRVLTMPMFLTDQRKFSYSLHLAFVSLLDRVGARFEGQPYNLGIWHAPFIAERYDRKTIEELRAFKTSQDPRDILNPNKFFRVRSRFAGIAGLLFRPAVFKLSMDVFHWTLRAGLVKMIAPPRSREAGPVFQDIKTPQFTFETPPEYNSRALARTALECTSCGMCVSVCPAYIHTRDERVTGRAKLWLARKLANGEPIAQTEADAAWECVRCRACAEVCQAQLPLMLAWERLEQELKPRFGRPDALLQDFMRGLEKNPEYRKYIGLTLPIQLQEQRWVKTEASPSTNHMLPATSPPRVIATPGLVLPPDEEFDFPAGPVRVQSAKYHVETKLAPPRFTPINKVSILRSDQCVSCGQCVEACIYGVHNRNPLDVRRMNEPDDYLCRGCFRCIQECPRQALTMVANEAYARLGRGPYTPDVLTWLMRQADDGRIPVLGAGYRGPFAGPGFDGMWTDMSEIVRPTRDGIHGREYISTAVNLGRRPIRLAFADGDLALPPVARLPLPIVFDDLPFHRARNVLVSLLRAAADLGTFAVVRRGEWHHEYASFANSIILDIAAEREADEFLAHFPLIQVRDPALIPRVKALAPDAVVMTRAGLDAASVEEIARQGAEVIHLGWGWEGAGLVEQLPRIHARLLDAGLRDQLTLVVSGGIAMAEHVSKTIILGADAVAIDLPLLVALECLLQDECVADGQCPRDVQNIDPAWGEQRIVNLMAAWRNQLLEVLGAMGMREVRRLRGERGRALFKQELDEKLFVPIFSDLKSLNATGPAASAGWEG